MITPGEIAQRAAVILAARSWLGTPFSDCQKAKGRHGGVDCAMLLLSVYKEAKVLADDVEFGRYHPSWLMHGDEEKFLDFVRLHAKEIGHEPDPGDIVMFKIGKVYGHGAIVTQWPMIIHARPQNMVMEEDFTCHNTGRYALATRDKKLFSPWGAKA